jgi:Tol biopolymer transport system component
MKRRAILLVTTILGSLLVLASPTPASADPACSIVEQVTFTTGAIGNATQETVIDGDGDRIAFVSSRDLTGGNPDLTREIFLADLTADTITQITDTDSAAGIGDPSISDDGTKVVFVTSADLTGNNTDNGDEVFLFNTATSTFSQLTDDPTGELVSDQPDISGDGAKVAFRSEADFTGGNGNGGEEIFLVNTSGPLSYQQLTSGAPDGGSVPSINQNGSRVAFQTTANLVPGTGNADGNTEIFVVDPAGPTTIQLTTTTAPAEQDRAEISENGAFVLFESTGNFGGGNPDGNRELFRRAVTSSTFVQLTDTITGAASSASTDQTGTRTVFSDDSAELDRNPDGDGEVFVADATGRDPSAVTANPAGLFSNFGSISDDGRTMALTARSDPFGTNADGNNEVFLARCGSITPTFNDVPASNAFFGAIEWMSELGIANGFPGPTFRPADPVKRQQMANFMYNLAGQPAFTPPVTPTFVDVPTSNPFFLQIEWMVSEGIANGFPGNLFKPNDAVKRQQMANFMYNLAGQPLFSPPGTPSFTDVPTSNPFYLQVEWMFDEGIANGFPPALFKPLDAVKRQQMANFMHNFAVRPGVDLS